MLASVCGFALASSLAMLTVVLPAGGVQEGLLVLLLTPATSVSAATAVVVLSRFLTVLADVVFALAGWAWARSHHLLTSRAERAKEGVVLEEDEAGDTARSSAGLALLTPPAASPALTHTVHAGPHVAHDIAPW